MKWGDLKSIIGAAAPIIGTVIGGPLGAAGGSLLAKALGVDETPEAVAAELQRDPQALLKVKELESTERIRFKELEADTYKAQLLDVQNARTAHQHSIMPALICGFLSLSVIAFGAAMLYVNIPAENLRIIDTLFGSILMAWIGSINYWVGTTRSSATKTMLMSK